jgi:hypothetical protein
MSNVMPSTSADLLKELGVAVGKNPVPAALIGMGLVWLFSSKKSQYGIPAAFKPASDATRPMGDDVRTVSDTARRDGQAAARRASEGASSLGRAAEDFPRSGLSLDRRFLSAARSELADLVQRQPLLLGAIGLAIGAGVAASLPMTETETDYLGETSAGLQDNAWGLAVEQSRRATDLAETVTTSVANEARDQGLSEEGLKAAAAETVQKMKNVIDKGVESARKQLGQRDDCLL